MVLDSLNSQDGSVSTIGQSWLVRALSLGDVVRILEPVLLLLLDPKTRRTAIQNVKRNFSAGQFLLFVDILSENTTGQPRTYNKTSCKQRA